MAYLRVAQRFKLPARTMLLVSMWSTALIAAWGMLGFVTTSVGLRKGACRVRGAA
jgi:hypothetical protein